MKVTAMATHSRPHGGESRRSRVARGEVSRTGCIERLAATAERTLVRLPRSCIDAKDRPKGKRERFARSIHQGGDPETDRAQTAEELVALARRSSGGDDVLDDQRALPAIDPEPPAEAHPPILALGEDRSGPGRQGHG